MSEKLKLLSEKINNFKLYLEATKRVSSFLAIIDEDTSIDQIAKKLEDRNKLILNINYINEKYKSSGNIEIQEQDEFNKLEWLCNAIIKDIAELDAKNTVEMKLVSKSFAQNIKSTNDSIKVINAYTKNSYLE